MKLKELLTEKKEYNLKKIEGEISTILRKINKLGTINKNSVLRVLNSQHPIKHFYTDDIKEFTNNLLEFFDFEGNRRISGRTLNLEQKVGGNAGEMASDKFSTGGLKNKPKTKKFKLSDKEIIITYY